MQDRKKYSIWDQYRYTFDYMRKKTGVFSLAVCAGDAVLSILLPFLEAALAGVAAACLVSSGPAGQILAMAAGYIILLQTVRFLQSHVRQLRVKLLFLFRGKMGPELDKKSLEMDGQSLESTQGQQKRRAASRNLYSGNEQGIEAFAAGFWDILIHFGGLVVYGVIVGRYSLLLLLLLTLQTMCTAWFHSLAGKREYKMEEEARENLNGLMYLKRESIAPGNGKDIRLYRMDRWFLGEFHEWIGKVTALIDKGTTAVTAAGIAGAALAFIRNAAVYGWLIMEMAKGNLTLPVFLLYVGIVAGV